MTEGSVAAWPGVSIDHGYAGGMCWGRLHAVSVGLAQDREGQSGTQGLAMSRGCQRSLGFAMVMSLITREKKRQPPGAGGKAFCVI